MAKTTGGLGQNMNLESTFVESQVTSFTQGLSNNFQNKALLWRWHLVGKERSFHVAKCPPVHPRRHGGRMLFLRLNDIPLCVYANSQDVETTQASVTDDCTAETRSLCRNEVVVMTWRESKDFIFRLTWF